MTAKKTLAVPDAPPPLTAFQDLKDKLEAERAELFPKWKAALEAAHGNVTHASKALDIPRDRGNRLTRRFQLTEYAASLRLNAGGATVDHGAKKGAVMGRPRKVKT